MKKFAIRRLLLGVLVLVRVALAYFVMTPDFGARLAGDLFARVLRIHPLCYGRDRNL